MKIEKSAQRPELEIFRRAAAQAKRTALLAGGQRCSYQQLLRDAHTMADQLLAGRSTLDGARVAILSNPGIDYVIVQWATWLAGGISVPLAISHPVPELRYVLQDAEVETLVMEPSFRPKIEEPMRKLRVRILDSRGVASSQDALHVTSGLAKPQDDALILYTSGTTGKPKGVVQTHSGLQAQIESLVRAWEWTSKDRILNILPLHHTHGVVNVLLCALWSGAICEFLYPFDAGQVWERLRSGRLSLFMAVPTIYSRLIEHWDSQEREEQEALTRGVARLRLMVSGSAALPEPVFEKWKRISGQTLLERYGMTEIGMALSNPLHGDRRPGTVGFPLPGVEVRLTDEQGIEISSDSGSGQIEVKGKTVFQRYWKRSRETQQAFRAGWFQTGDIAQRDSEGRYRILGRSSVDIIKTGGYKVSALEIEGVLLSHPRIRECAVVGIQDAEWGERVCVAVVCTPGEVLELDDLRRWAKERLAPYKVPSRMQLCSQLPRNAMGKVTKPDVRQFFPAPNREP